MQKLLISIFLMLALAIPQAVFATDDDADEATVEATESTEDNAADEDAAGEDENNEAIGHVSIGGSGWQLINKLEMGSSGKFVHMVLVEQERYDDKTAYSNAISRLCKDEKEFCRVRFWSQARWVPEKVSVSAEQYQHIKADYLLNKSGDQHRLQWSCSVDPNSDNCIQ